MNQITLWRVGEDDHGRTVLLQFHNNPMRSKLCRDGLVLLQVSFSLSSSVISEIFQPSHMKVSVVHCTVPRGAKVRPCVESSRSRSYRFGLLSRHFFFARARTDSPIFLKDPDVCMLRDRPQGSGAVTRYIYIRQQTTVCTNRQ